MQPSSVFTRRIIAPVVRRRAAEGAGRLLPALLLPEQQHAAARNLFRCINAAPSLGIGRRLVKEEWLQPQRVVGETYYLVTHVRLKQYDVADGIVLGVMFRQGLPQWSSPKPIPEATTAAWRILPPRAEDADVARTFRRLKLARDHEIIQETLAEEKMLVKKDLERVLARQMQHEAKQRKIWFRS